MFQTSSLERTTVGVIKAENNFALQFENQLKQVETLLKTPHQEDGMILA